ncbi:MAG: P-loop NTPase [Halalkalicoccus sp.]
MTDDEPEPERGAPDGCPSGDPSAGNYRPMDDPTLSGAPHRRDGQPDDPPMPEDVPEEKRIRTAFVSTVREIDTPRGDPVAAEILTDVGIEEGVLTATLDTSGIEDGVADRVGDQLLGRALAIEGVEHCRIQSVRHERAEDGLAPNGVGTVLAIGGAKGGTGKSTITVALARALREAGLSVGIFDADFEAPAVSELLGVEEMVTTTPTGNPSPALVEGLQVVSLDLVSGDRPMAWRGAMAHDVLADLLGNATWSGRDVLLVDLPPGVGEVTKNVLSRVPVDGALLVTTPGDVSVKNVERTAGLADAHDVPVAAVVENMVGERGIDRGERGIGRLLEATPGAPRIRLPFDPAMRAADPNRSELEPETERALDELVDTVRTSLARVAEDVPTEAVDLSGLPERLCERQALLEYGAAPDGPRPLVVGGGDLPALLEREFDAALDVTELESGRRLVRADPEFARTDPITTES